MKTLFRSLFVAVVALAAACSSDNDHDALSVNGSSVDISIDPFSGDGGSETVTLLATKDWSVTKPVWVNVSPSSGKGSMEGQTVTIYASVNPGNAREGAVVFEMDGRKVRVNISQSHGYVVEERAAGNIQAFDISADGRYLAGWEPNGEDDPVYYVWDMRSQQTSPVKVTASAPHEYGWQVGVTIINDGRLIAGAATPDGSIIAYRGMTHIDDAYTDTFYTPSLYANGSDSELPCPDTDVLGHKIGDGYLGNSPMMISATGVVISGYMEYMNAGEMIETQSCFWIRNAWGDGYTYKLVGDIADREGDFRPVAKGLSPDGKYMLCEYSKNGTVIPAVCDMTLESVEFMNDLSGCYAVCVSNDGILFYGTEKDNPTMVYAGGRSHTLKEWLQNRYKIIMDDSGSKLIFVGATPDLSVVAWKVRQNDTWRNFVLRPGGV